MNTNVAGYEPHWPGLEPRWSGGQGLSSDLVQGYLDDKKPLSLRTLQQAYA
jgi:hypothetical protein